MNTLTRSHWLHRRAISLLFLLSLAAWSSLIAQVSDSTLVPVHVDSVGTSADSSLITIMEDTIITASDSTESDTLAVDLRSANLVSHNWFIVEVLDTKNDSSINTTVFFQPCERDNFLEFALDGSYTLYEGEEKCQEGVKDIKGEGVWEFNEDSTSIIDRYAGGRAVEKQILHIDEQKLKVRFEGEGGKVTTITYFSEAARGDESLAETLDDPTNHPLTITRLIRDKLVQKGRYAMVSPQEIEEGVVFDPDSEDYMYKKLIAVYPISGVREDAASSEGVVAWEQKVMEDARNAGVEYVITGEVLKQEAKAKDDYYRAEIEYAIKILDTQLSEVKSVTTMASSYPPSGQGVKVLKTVSQLVVVTIGPRYYNETGYYNYYNNNFSNVEAVSREVGNIFDNVESAKRVAAYKKTGALIKAIQGTEKEIDKFIDKYLPLDLGIVKISEMDKKGIPRSVKIEGGSSAMLKVNDVLEVVRIEILTLPNGKVVEEVEEIGTLTVKSIDNAYLATCKVSGGAKELAKHVEHLDELHVLTTARSKMGMPFGERNK